MPQTSHYVTPTGQDVFGNWFEDLKDKRVIRAIERRLLQLQLGNFGDHKFCDQGVWELRFFLTSGVRIYYALDGIDIVLLLCAGDKSSQSRDIARAVTYWQEFKGRER